MEHVARLTNAMGIELCKIYMDSSVPAEGKGNVE